MFSFDIFDLVLCFTIIREVSENQPLLMQEGHELLEEDIRRLIAEAKGHLQMNSGRPNRPLKCTNARDAIGYALKLLHDYKIQIASCQGRSEKEHHLAVIQELHHEIQELKERYASQSTQIKDSRIRDQHPVGSTLTMARDIQEMREKTLASLDRSERVVGCTEELANDASERLRIQRDKFYEINEGLDSIGSQIHRARREMNAFLRRMMRDKVIVFFSLLIFVGIVIALSIKYRHRRK
ncbi:Actin-like protein [Perkinsela sp. CCAP 1560/4]|nr:Actin-like protein [Perkinsela sp. CCAP 1560/4]|eukprot:KNH06073.1 Actin-like protein [Perkinsela sp. CCAP 1560/4]